MSKNSNVFGDTVSRKQRMSKRPKRRIINKARDVYGFLTGTKLVRVNEFDGSHHFIRVDK
jgi:hypothetical protein